MRSLAALCFVGLAIAACTAPIEGQDSTSSAQSVAGRWAPSAAAKTAGAKVRIAYESPPKWTGTKGCGGKLLAGTAKMGKYLQDKYTVITSVGGYSCRQNTANKSETSVHGTGRAMDIMIPTVGGAADNTAGDPIANWLVQNATKIGIQLVIWDRSVWHCDGRNDTPYTGPVPHVDHIHAELTKKAAAMQTDFFTSGAINGGADDDMDDDSGTSTTTTTTTTDAGTDSSTTDTDTDTDTDTTDTDTTDTDDTGGMDGTDDDGPGEQMDSGTPPKVDAGPPSTKESTPPVTSDETHDDGPATDQTIPPSTKPRTKSPAAQEEEDAALASSGCSMRATGSSGVPDIAWALGLVGAFVVVRRRRRR